MATPSPFDIRLVTIGHLVAAIGNVGEILFWRLFGGMPTEWITRTSQTLLSSSQVELVERKLQTRLGITDKPCGLDPKVWWPISRQIYADIAKNGKPERIGGLAAATFALACVATGEGKCSVALGLIVLTAVYDYRAYRFGVHYGRELYLQFLVLESTETSKPLSNAESKR